MKKLLVIFIGGFMILNTAISRATEVKIQVSGIDTKRGGNIAVMIFGKNGFPKAHDKALFVQETNSLQETMSFVFNLTLKEFAVKVWHDENQDGKVTKNWTGIYPKEGLGFSNSQKVGFTGPPSYKKSKVSKKQSLSGLKISIRYP